MMKQTLIAPLLLGATLVTGQSPATPVRSASMDDLVNEVRGLRSDIQQLADSSIRAQLLVARLQVQEQRIAGIARQLADTEEQISKMDGARNPMLAKMLKDFETQTPADPDEAEFVGLIKAQLERVQNGDPALKERQAALSRLLADEQARWVGFNTQLEDLERRITTPRR
jgi:uncharacterized protein YlxW (UPF0749 family)